MLKKAAFICAIILPTLSAMSQTGNCTFKEPQFIINFGSGFTRDLNSVTLSSYRRVGTSCPSDGYYSLSSFTQRCFHDDWHTLPQDHTPGDAEGNMLLVNGAPEGGTFLVTPVTGLKPNTIYEVGIWVMNLCRPTDKCPFPLLPNLIVRLETPEGKRVAGFITGMLTRVAQPKWTHYTAQFTTPPSSASLVLVMTNNVPGGCGNDFTVDDITFRECVKPITQVAPLVKPKPVRQRVPVKKTPAKPPLTTNPAVEIRIKPDSIAKPGVTAKPVQTFAPAPLILKTRENALVKKIETETGEIKIEIYDNGEIDGDTVSIYHNNTLVRSHARLSQKPITLKIGIDPSQSHHEIIMVAENLGSIPPNTSVMIVTTANNRYGLMITSTEQKNAKVIFDLKK